MKICIPGDKGTTLADKGHCNLVQAQRFKRRGNAGG